ncbi:MAG TPA: helix-turn-helix transcriptional regulator [Myxococcaceae bacterium]|nr:helix-turn-helix transcriptional regulator [Myxococcaceae bacterium]
MDYSEFGTYLAQQRELRGMTREEVADRTKISPSLLEALEDGNAERLPERVFVANYVRAYAQVIGLSPEEALLRYEEIHGGENASAAPTDSGRPQRRRSGAWRLFLLVAILIAVAAAVAAVVWWSAPAG